MQNSKCKVQNCGVSFGNNSKFIGEADTIILHFAFYILHLGSLCCPININLTFRINGHII